MPSKRPQINLRLPEDEAAALREAAATAGITVTAFLRLLVQEGLRRRKPAA